METVKNVFYMTIVLWLSGVSSQVIQDPILEATTENFDISSYAVTEFPDGNGTAIEDIPGADKTDNSLSGAEGKQEESFAVEEQPVVVSFPDNHKNFTPSQYLGDEEFPPYYNHLNPYQQQYKNYFEQKQIYNRKPIKFETDSLKNFYVPSRPDSLDLEDEKKNEDTRINHNSFPYVFENEKAQEQVKRHKNTGQVLVHEQPVNENWFRGHQENILPYYVFPHSHPHEEKFHNNELSHFDHHHVKKDEKESPWKKVFHVLTALVPLGLLLATLTPSVISINSTAAAKTTRQRSEDSSYLRFKEEDVIKLMKKYGVESLSEAQCEDKIICELARKGGKNLGGPVERGFWFLANQTPWDVAEKAGMNELFKAIKTGNCEVYKCHTKTKSTLGKKIMRRQKTGTT